MGLVFKQPLYPGPLYPCIAKVTDGFQGGDAYHDKNRHPESV